MINRARSNLEHFVARFRKDHEESSVVFVMMRFANVELLNAIFNHIKDTLKKEGVSVVRADDKDYTNTIWENIQVYMKGADAGIAVFDYVSVGGEVPKCINPNVSAEAGYMMGLEKPVLILKDKNLPRLPTDFISHLYHAYDGDNPKSVKRPVKTWIRKLLS